MSDGLSPAVALGFVDEPGGPILSRQIQETIRKTVVGQVESSASRREDSRSTGPRLDEASISPEFIDDNFRTLINDLSSLAAEHQLRSLQTRDSLDLASIPERIRSSHPGIGELDEELLQLDLSTNRALQQTYAAAVADPNINSDKVLVRTALLQWCVLLRRKLLSSMHTSVEGLQHDTSCSGDIIGDRLVLRYFDCLFEEQDGKVEAVRALTALARQSACLSSRQSAWFAAGATRAYSELEAFLRQNGLERLMPPVAQACSNVFLLFYDVEKYQGLESPFAKWFMQNYDLLVRGIESQRLPALWHGLWLFDRRTGHLVGYRGTNEGLVKDENYVELTTFFSSIIKRENLGRLDCSFAEMVERGPSVYGYLCSGAVCSEPPSRGPLGTSTSRASMFTWLPFASARSLLGGDPLKETICDAASPRGSGSDRCRESSAAGQRTREAASVACIAEQAIGQSEDRRRARCLSEATGLCAGPLEKAQKRIESALFVGVPLGKFCQLAKDPGKEQKPKPDPKPDPAEEKRDAQLKRELLEQSRRALKDALDAANKTIDRSKKEGVKSPQEAAVVAGALAARPGLEAAIRQLDKLIDEQKKREAKADEAMKKKGGAHRCPPDTPDCGGDDCTGMARAMKETMRCFAATEDPRDPKWKGYGHKPGVIDPSPLDDPSDPRWTRCLKLLDTGLNLVDKRCWAVDCGGMVTMNAATGHSECACGGPALGGPSNSVRGNCGNVDCAEGTPTFMNGHCGCGPAAPGGSGHVPQGPSGPIPGPFVVGPPPTFIEGRILLELDGRDI
ncbi:hypothetical protein [Micromonospora sp. IBSANI012]|uniref:hypothetical protein n=1 Tax=Micromonospora sp. IBSANI012 TaxID=3457761 RepID=UPI0040597861